MSAVKIVTTALALFLGLAFQAYGQKRDTNHEVYKTACPSEASLTAPDALTFLKNNPPTQANAVCVTWAIYVVGDEPYEPAVPTLITLLNFQRPNIQQTWDHLPGSMYPAVEALEDIGGPSLHALLGAIEAPTTSPTAQANAVEAWLLIIRIADKQSHGFAALRRAANAANDDGVKKRLETAIQNGLKRWCRDGDSDHAKCVQAAADGVDR